MPWDITMAAARAAGPRLLHWTMGSSTWPRARATLPGAASVTRGPAAGGCPQRGSSRARAGGGQQQQLPFFPMAPAGALAGLTRGRAGPVGQTQDAVKERSSPRRLPCPSGCPVQSWGSLLCGTPALRGGQVTSSLDDVTPRGFPGRVFPDLSPGCRCRRLPAEVTPVRPAGGARRPDSASVCTGASPSASPRDQGPQLRKGLIGP